MKTSKLIQTRSLHFPENGIYIRGDKELQERINLLIGYFRKNYFDKKYKKVADIVDKNIIFNASKKRGCLSGIMIQKFLLNPNGEEFEEYFPNIRNFFDSIYNAIPKELFEHRGCLITIEGGDCVGKTTIMSKLDLGDIQTRSLHFPENGIYIRGDKELQERINLLIGYFRKNYFDKKYKKVT